MNIWLIKIGEPLPRPDGSEVRLMRMGLLAQFLADRGHTVTWWTSGFEHQTKQNLFEKDTTINFRENYQVKYLYAEPYLKNISIERLRHYNAISKKIKKGMAGQTPPDLILCSLPTVLMPYLATNYGKKHNVPVVIDIRDLWPDIFIEKFSGYIKPKILKLLLFNMYRQVKIVCKQATHIISISQKWMYWGINHAEREATAMDRYFPIANNLNNINTTEESKKYIDDFFISHKLNNKIIIVFLGTVAQTQLKGFETLYKACLFLRQENVAFIIAGMGDHYEQFKKQSQHLENIIYPGWLTPPQVKELLFKSQLSINPYYTSTFEGYLGNKVAEYFAAGLPTITCLQGTLSEIINKYNCGEIYNVDDPESLVKAVMSYVANPDKLKLASERAKKAFDDLFNSNKVYPEMVDYLEKVVDDYPVKSN